MPWWLAGGDETCPSCERRYAYEIEVRCIDCDGPMCPVCAAWVERRSYCKGCAPRSGEGKARARSARTGAR